MRNNPSNINQEVECKLIQEKMKSHVWMKNWLLLKSKVKSFRKKIGLSNLS